MLILGDLAWVVVVPVALLLREGPRDAAAERVAGEPGYSMGQVLRAPQFWAIALTHFACCAAHSGPIFHMVTHATDQGVPAMTAASAMKPRPPVMPSLNELRTPTDRNAPPAAASIPDRTTAK